MFFLSPVDRQDDVLGVRLIDFIDTAVAQELIEFVDDAGGDDPVKRHVFFLLNSCGFCSFSV